jgi:hypothetical protein
MLACGRVVNLGVWVGNPDARTLAQSSPGFIRRKIKLETLTITRSKS